MNLPSPATGQSVEFNGRDVGSVSAAGGTVDNAAATQKSEIKSSSAEHSAEVEKPLSKNAQKKLARQQKYDAARPERMLRTKQRKLAKREAFKAAVASGEIQKPIRQKLVQEPSTLRVLIDCSFDELMVEKEIKSMTSQLTRCYSENRTAKHPCELIITGFNAKIADRFHTVFKDQQKNWSRVRVFQHDYLDAEGQSAISDVRKEDLIYLSADSENTVDTIDESKTYIIGGIVDKNRHKNLCQNKASEQGIQTARLPIGDYIQMASRKVLTVNHVFEIMSRWLETKDWEESFLRVIPRRKLNECGGGNGPLAEDDEESAHEELDDNATRSLHDESVPPNSV